MSEHLRVEIHFSGVLKISCVSQFRNLRFKNYFLNPQ